jgi:hypothetical protein
MCRCGSDRALSLFQRFRPLLPLKKVDGQSLQLILADRCCFSILKLWFVSKWKLGRLEYLSDLSLHFAVFLFRVPCHTNPLLLLCLTQQVLFRPADPIEVKLFLGFHSFDS